MTTFSSFALQFTGFTGTSLSATAAELLIVEAGVTGASGQATLSTQDLDQLWFEGRTVIGYVNTSVTDHNRAYWQAEWVTPSGDEPDVGSVSQSAPIWLRDNLGQVDFDPAHPGAEATLVDYRDPSWRALVIAQAVAVVQAGFHGVFLDDVARYFEAGYAGGTYDPALADSMMALVIAVAQAVREVNPDAVVVVNSGVYIGGDSAAGTASQLFADYKAAIDGVLIENQYASEVAPALPNVLSDAQANFTGIDILALENAAGGLDPLEFFAFAAANGLLPYVSPDAGYGQFATAPQIDFNGVSFLTGSATAANVIFGLAGEDVLSGGAAADTIYGGVGDDEVRGFGGRDLVYGETGDDILNGQTADDQLYGGTGADSLSGEAGDDTLTGGDGADVLYAGDGDDLLYGEAGKDVMQGSDGADRLYGGDDNDVLAGGIGDDLIHGGAGSDGIDGAGGNDLIYAGSGDGFGSAANGGTGRDTIFGGSTYDLVMGDGGADDIYGGAGNDMIYGGGGLDRLFGGAGDDTFYGGRGHRDVFVFAGNAGRDKIVDFDDGRDRIDLTAYAPTNAEVMAAIRDFNGGVMVDFTLLGGAGSVRIWDQGAQVISLTLSDFLI